MRCGCHEFKQVYFTLDIECVLVVMILFQSARLRRSWDAIASRFIGYLKKGSDKEAISTYDQHPFILGNGVYIVGMQHSGR